MGSCTAIALDSRNNVLGEFAGVAFSPDGRTMYVNCYTPGTTFAVTGPWRQR